MKGDGDIAPGIVSRGGKPHLKVAGVGIVALLHALKSGESSDEVTRRLGVPEDELRSAFDYACEILSDELDRQRSYALRSEREIKVAPGITANRDVRSGSPVVNGTRIDVALIMDNLAAGWSLKEIQDAYGLKPEQLGLIFTFAADVIDRETVFAATD